MAQSNKIGLAGMAILRHLQNDACSHCGQKLNATYDFSFAHGNVRIETASDYRTEIAHIVPESKGGKNTLGNYTLQHSYCNGIYHNLDFETVSRASGSVLSFETIKQNAQNAVTLNAQVIKGQLSIAEVKQFARELIGQSTEWTRRTSPALLSTLTA
jgi:hypothetical protein